VPANATLEVSYLGYITQEIAVNGQSTINVTLKEDTQTLDEVVVTALGIKRDTRALGYAVSTV
jgi:iron complex outermembrane receptor protein